MRCDERFSLRERRVIRKMVRQELNRILEQEKWSQDVDVEAGKMHRYLGLDQDEDITDVYEGDPEGLLDDLLAACDSRQECSGMLSYAANLNPAHNVFDDALALMGEGYGKEE